MTETYKAWERIDEFIREYRVKSSNQETYLWSRVIDHGYFYNLRPETNVLLWKVFAGIVVFADPKSRIRLSNWFEKNEKLVESGVKLGILI